jgi:hypothetical protein
METINHKEREDHNNCDPYRLRNRTNSKIAFKREGHFRFELKHAARFLVRPVIGFGGAVAAVGSRWNGLLRWLRAGSFCHYWLDGRIWARRAMAT